MAKKSKIIPRSRLVGHYSDTIDTIDMLRSRGGKALDDHIERATDVLFAARDCWDSLHNIRVQRDRCFRYTYGDQWSDEVYGDDVWCRKCTERDLIRERGDEPLSNNLIRKLIRTVVGVYRQQDKVPTCTANDRDEQALGDIMSTALHVNWRVNHKKELDSRCFENYLIGGIAIQKETYGWNSEAKRRDCWTYLPMVNRMFWDPNAVDVRGWDMDIIGEIKDLSFGALCAMFVNVKGDVAKLREIYGRCRRREVLYHSLEGALPREDRFKLNNMDFFMPYDTSLCRVIEVWTKESRVRYHVWDPLNGTLDKCEQKDCGVYEEINALRLAEGIAQGLQPEEIPLIELEMFVDRFWYYRYLSPMGDILDEGETMYDHGSHPYALKLYPMVDGEIHSLAGDVIDQQRYINRLISLNDKLIRSSAKGVLMYPMSLLPDDMTPEQLTQLWNSPDSVIFFDDEKNMRTGAKPEQIANRLTNIGIDGLLQIEMNLVEEITGVNGALQGKPGYSGQSGLLYAQQTQNASTSILDLLESYDDMILQGASKKVKNIQQFYDTARKLSIAGKQAAVVYDPALFGNVDFDLSINESIDTPAARAISNELLMQLLQMGAINVKQLLENGTFPFADKLLASLKADEQAAMQQQMAAQQGGQPADGGGQQPMMPQAAAAEDEEQGQLPRSAEQVANIAQAQQLLQYPILTQSEVAQRLRERNQ